MQDNPNTQQPEPSMRALRAAILYPERRLLHSLVQVALAYIDTHHTTATPPPYKLPAFSRVEYMKLSHDTAWQLMREHLVRRATALDWPLTLDEADAMLRRELRHEMTLWYTRALHMFESVELADMTLRHRHAVLPEPSNEQPALASPLNPTNLNPNS